MKHSCLCAGLFAAAFFCLSTPFAGGQGSPSPTPEISAAPTETPAPKIERASPYRGTIGTVDAEARTFTVAGKEKPRVFKISERTTITKGGEPATLKDVVAEMEVRGSYWKKEDGSLEAKTVKLGPRTEAEKAAKKARKEAKASPSPAG